MMKPDFISDIESQIDKPLQQLERLADLEDSVRYAHNFSYVLEEGRLVALNVTDTDLLSDLMVDEETCATLKYINLTRNKNLSRVRFEASLPWLCYLDVSKCALERLTLPSGCRQLEKLWLQDSGLTRMTFSGPCPNLLLLDLSGNDLGELVLPEGFDSLAHLYAVGSGLVDLEFGCCENLSGDEDNCTKGPLPQLETLHLAQNRLENISENIVFSEKLTALYLGGNVPKNIPKIFLGEHSSYGSYDCLDDTRTWFIELLKKPYERNRSVKLMLLGNGNVGKSTLACAMEHGRCDHDPETTHGILIDTLDSRDISYNIWDFGGQEVYHGTHRLFISSEALQVIVFDAETEENARNDRDECDRARPHEKVRPHPIRYWYETTSKLSSDSIYFIVQNRKEKPNSIIDTEIEEYAKGRAKFIPLNAKTGDDVDDLMHYLKKNARHLPDYNMKMPPSWLRLRQFFIDNLKKADSKKMMLKQDFEELCKKMQVMERSRPLLFRYLYHSGFIYYHENLGDRIIADQRWALKAIYKPYDRKSPSYDEFLDFEGKIRVSKLFQVFGDDYSDNEKWLFLEFMQSCGLCFRLNDKSWRETDSESDLYVFPEFLRKKRPVEVQRYWDDNERETLVLRYKLPWLNYYLIQSFITALGRKTETKNFWRYGIHISTPEGWFKVELDYDEKALMLYIEKRAADSWIVPILEELQGDREQESWEISVDGIGFTSLDPEEWRGYEKYHGSGMLADSEESRLTLLEPSEEQGQKDRQKALLGKLEEPIQELDREVIVFLAANPTADRLSMRNEHSQIAEKLSARDVRKNIEIIPRFDISPDRMIDTIHNNKPTIIHFVSHGREVNRDTGKGGGIVLHADDFQGAKELGAVKLKGIFSRIKKKLPRLNVVFMSACYTEPQAVAISENGIYTIGATDELSSTAARAFAAGFYKSYGQTGNIEEAVDYGLTVGLSADENIESLVHLFYDGKRIVV